MHSSIHLFIQPVSHSCLSIHYIEVIPACLSFCSIRLTIPSAINPTTCFPVGSSLFCSYATSLSLSLCDCCIEVAEVRSVLLVGKRSCAKRSNPHVVCNLPFSHLALSLKERTDWTVTKSQIACKSSRTLVN